MERYNTGKLYRREQRKNNIL